MLHLIFNPLVALGLMLLAICTIAAWAIVTQEGEDMESQSEDYSYFASKAQEDAKKFRQTG